VDIVCFLYDLCVLCGKTPRSVVAKSFSFTIPVTFSDADCLDFPGPPIQTHGSSGRRGTDRAFSGCPAAGPSPREHELGSLHAELLKRGFVDVSIDYRLAPETKLPGIIEDIRPRS
jgi:hypothetical protein